MAWPDPPVARDFASRLGDLGYSVESVRERLGEVAANALDRGSIVPARQMLHGDRSGQATVIRMFLLADPVPPHEATDAVGPLAESLGELLRPVGDQVGSAVEVAPYAVDDHDWLVAADWPSARMKRPVAADHVLGVGGASTMLAQCTVRPTIESALDLGTGCGVQAFHLAEHAQRVVATDISRRCLDLAHLDFAMNDVSAQLKQGNFFDPVEGDTFDLIVSNPPFVIGSPDGTRHDYRDSGLPGDLACELLVDQAASHLNDGGWCQFLANWEIVDGDDWSAHPRAWLSESSLDAWVVQRDVSDLAAYVENWLRDTGEHSTADADAIYDAWLSNLTARGTRGVGFGLISLRKSGRNDPVRVFQHAPQHLEQPVGPDIQRWFDAQDRLAHLPGADVLTQPWSCATDVEILEEFAPGASEPSGQSVRRRTGFAWGGSIDDFGVALLARTNGVESIAEFISHIAAEWGIDPYEAFARSVPVVRQLVAEGFLVDP